MLRKWNCMKLVEAYNRVWETGAWCEPQLHWVLDSKENTDVDSWFSESSTCKLLAWSTLTLSCNLSSLQNPSEDCGKLSSLCTLIKVHICAFQFIPVDAWLIYNKARYTLTNLVPEKYKILFQLECPDITMKNLYSLR